MREDDLYDEIRERGGLHSTEAARDAAKATLETVGRRINRDEWRDVRRQLPEEYASLYEVSAKP